MLRRSLCLSTAGLLALICLTGQLQAQEITTAAPPATANGQIGERQSREAAAPNIEPLGRVQNRVSNRVQSRVRNRIDRSYRPQVGPSSAFETAAKQAEAGAAPR